VPTDQSAEARLGQDIWRAVRRSNAWLATAAVITLSLLHVYLVAGYDVKTTLVMLRLVDRTQVLLATLIVALPAHLPLMLNAQVRRRIFRGLRFGNVDWKDQALSAAAATFGALALVNVLTPLVWAVVAVSSVAAYLRNRRLRKVGRMGPGGTRIIRAAQLHSIQFRYLLAILFLLYFFLSQPWCPASGSRLRKGKAMSRDMSWARTQDSWRSWTMIT